MTALIHRHKRLDAGEYHQVLHRAETVELCRRHGFPGGEDISWVEYDVVDAPLLRFGVRLRDEDGKLYLDCPHPRFAPRQEDLCNCGVATAEVEKALVGSLPDWWQPDTD